MLTNIKEFVKARLDDIILIIGVILVSLFSFALGYIISQYQNKEPVKFQVNENSYYRGGNLRIVFGPEIG